MIVAIDGLSSCGKSTLAREVAAKLDLLYIDSGAMYRAVTYYMLTNGIGIDDDEAIRQMMDSIDIRFQATPSGNQTFLNGENVESKIRDKAVSAFVSPVSTVARIRESLVAKQQQMAANGAGIVMDGRDIGTVVFPNADFKFFITAELQIRAERRFEELKALGKAMTMEEVTTNLKERDRIDSSRQHSPLKKAEDAIEIDNSYLNRREQLDVVISYIRNAD